MLCRSYRSVRYRRRCCTDTGTGSGTYVHTGTAGTGIDVVPNLPKCSVPVLMSHRTYRSFWYRYWCRTEHTEVSKPGTKVCTATAGTDMAVVPNLPKFPAPVLMSYRTYRSFRYRYCCHTERTEVSGTGNTAGIYRRYALVRTVPSTPLEYCPIPTNRGDSLRSSNRRKNQC